MPNIKIINDRSEISLGSEWVAPVKFNSKDRVVNQNGETVVSSYQGRQYRIIEKWERPFSCQERLERGLLGAVIVICSLSLALFSKSVRDLFTKSKETIRYAVLVQQNQEALKKNSDSDLDETENASHHINPQLPLDPLAKTKAKDVDNKSLLDPNPELTKAREQFLEWFSSPDSELGKGEYETLIAQVASLSQNLPTKKITIVYDGFRFGFSIVYVEKSGDGEDIQLSRDEGIILSWQANGRTVMWPLKDPKNGGYFNPEVTMKYINGSHSGSETTGSYLSRLVKNLNQPGNTKSREILERLIGYAKDIQKQLGNVEYKKLRQNIPAYPELPPLDPYAN